MVLEPLKHLGSAHWARYWIWLCVLVNVGAFFGFEKNDKLMGTLEIGIRTAIMKAIEDLRQSYHSAEIPKEEAEEMHSTLAMRESVVLNYLSRIYKIDVSNAKIAIEDLEKQKLLVFEPNDDSGDRYLKIGGIDKTEKELKQALMLLFQK